MDKLFPLFVSLVGKQFVVYGGGTIATRRVKVVLDFGAKVTVIAPQITPELQSFPITWIPEPYNPDMPQADFVLVATDNFDLNHQIVENCRNLKIPVNNASNQSECDFQFPAIAQKEAVVVGINAGGTDHKLVKSVASKIRTFLEELL